MEVLEAEVGGVGVGLLAAQGREDQLAGCPGLHLGVGVGLLAAQVREDPLAGCPGILLGVGVGLLAAQVLEDYLAVLVEVVGLEEFYKVGQPC